MLRWWDLGRNLPQQAITLKSPAGEPIRPAARRR